MIGPLLQVVKLAAFAAGVALAVAVFTPHAYALILGVWVFFFLLAFFL